MSSLRLLNSHFNFPSIPFVVSSSNHEHFYPSTNSGRTGDAPSLIPYSFCHERRCARTGSVDIFASVLVVTVASINTIVSFHVLFVRVVHPATAAPSKE